MCLQCLSFSRYEQSTKSCPSIVGKRMIRVPHVRETSTERPKAKARQMILLVNKAIFGSKYDIDHLFDGLLGDLKES